MLHLYQSNRLEDLAELLTQLHTTAPLSNPFASEQIIVQSQACAAISANISPNTQALQQT